MLSCSPWPCCSSACHHLDMRMYQECQTVKIVTEELFNEVFLSVLFFCGMNVEVFACKEVMTSLYSKGHQTSTLLPTNTSRFTRFTPCRFHEFSLSQTVQRFVNHMLKQACLGCIHNTESVHLRNLLFCLYRWQIIFNEPWSHWMF